MKPVVLVPGGWHGPWCWELVTPALDIARVPWVAVDLPSCAKAEQGCDLVDDAQHVNALLDSLPGDEPAVVLGHSRGGMVLSEIGETQLTANIERLSDGSTLPRVGPGARIFYNDCSGEDIAWALSMLRPQVLGGRGPSATSDAWRSAPATFVICARDRAFHPDGQRFVASRARTILEWDSGHSPFLSRPELVSTLLVGLSAA